MRQIVDRRTGPKPTTEVEKEEAAAEESISKEEEEDDDDDEDEVPITQRAPLDVFLSGSTPADEVGGLNTRKQLITKESSSKPRRKRRRGGDASQGSNPTGLIVDFLACCVLASPSS